MGEKLMKAEKKRDRLTRRNCIKTAAVSAGSAALAGAGSREAAAAQQSQISKWDYEAEVLVPGIGGAGLTSAIAARDLGADVLILEKASEAHAGGNTRVCMQGVWCPPNLNEAVTYQKALNGQYPVPDEVFQAYYGYTTKSFEWLKKTCSGKIGHRAASNGAEFPELPGSEQRFACALRL
jgi:hypothetical protein